MRRYTSTHWGLREIVEEAGGTVLRPVDEDPHPSAIGLDQLSPDLQSLRVRRPAVRESWLKGGPGAAGEQRGNEPFIEVEWDQALDLVAAELDRVRKTHGNGAIYGGSYGWASAGRFHHAQGQLHRFLNTIGGYVAHRNSYSLGAAHVILPHVVMRMGTLMEAHTDWQTLAEHCELFVTFGGVPEKNAQVSPGGVLRHHLPGALGRMRAAGVEFVNIGPVADNIAKVAQAEWIPARPNTDTAFMLALAHVLLEEDLHDRAFLASHCVGFDRFAAYLRGEADGQPKSPDWAARITGAPAQSIRGLARRMASRRTMVNMAWSLQRADHGEQPCWAVVALAAMLGQIGLPGGGFGVGYGAANVIGGRGRRLPAPTLPQGHNPVQDFIPVARIADMLLNPGARYPYDGETRTYPDIRLVYWAGGNPFHHHQDLNRLRHAWSKPDTIVVNEQYWTATARHADIVLPATLALEREDIGYAGLEGHLVWMSRAAPPLAEARDDFTIFAGLAGRLGVQQDFTEGRAADDWLRHLYDDSRQRMLGEGVALPDFDSFREAGLVKLPVDDPIVLLQDFRADPRAHPLDTPSGRIEISSERIAAMGLADCGPHPMWFPPREWLGAAAAETWPLHLLSDQPRGKLHSQLDAGAASRAERHDGHERLWISPADAAARGLARGDLVEIANSRGRSLARAWPDARIMAGTVRLATGAWFRPEGDRDLAGNPNVLTADRGTSGLAQGSAAQSCLVEVTRL
ncbi:dimethylsulfoxide reductase [Defluviimonas sp. 20V17]|uniref:Biotin/methionine sulfoxide reductase n=1 Tax=Allgaiera indica TaxID=765699 RepID=A0AAN4UTE4_9RHOB|nr:molybdopterin-dependent oxidoreductase [Allgaiera indica]KDB02019.1 dimethylsulfoxide reductase [Defluviimonas sp. 20V17]GHE03303.1 dimethylsulfoxide reductase [Allgaiera indica]SDX23081.1 biotin/methionine sulfoxide reductase [Allgaiera indica]